MADEAAILVVDDEAVMQEVLATLLAKEGYKVYVAATGEAGIDLANAESIDAVVLDVMMPPPDGLEVLRLAGERARENGSKIVMCTAKTSAEAEVEFRSLGADFVLHKPFKPLKMADYLRGL